MIIRYTHPARGLVTHEVEFDCLNCGLHFADPAPEELQQAPNDPVTVHCTRCLQLVRAWSPPPPPEAVDPNAPRRIVQRKVGSGEATVATGQADANGGWSTVLSLQSVPLEAGAYEFVCSFELSLSAVATWAASGPNRTAQARLQYNGSEIATWVNPFDVYTCLGGSAGVTLSRGATPLFELQLRRFGTAGSARIRRARLELHPIVTPDIEDTV